MSADQKLPIVDIGVACYGNQSPSWWVPLFEGLLSGHDHQFKINRINVASSMLKDDNKNGIVEEKHRSHFTDVNRVAVTDGFLASEAEWLFWIDDDTVPPMGALAQLLSLKRQFVSGLYFLPKSPFNPIAYIRNSDGTYSAFYDYPEGSLVQVDSVGMGCCLIHKEVYLKIKENFRVLKRPNGSTITLHKKRFQDKKPFTGKKHDGFVANGVYHLPLYELDPEDPRPFPFYQLEYTRTEDHAFCEMAAEVGFKPWLDTNVVCEHWKLHPFGKKEYHEQGIAGLNQEAREKMEGGE